MLMEKPLDLSFPPYRRRSPLDSETYHTLVRILSQCHQSECSLTTQISPQDLRADNGTNELVQACGNVEVVSSDRTGHENMLAQKETAVEEHNELSGFQDRVICDTQRVIDEIEHIMRLEEDKSLPGLEGKTSNESTEGSSREQMILDEFQHLLEGKVEVQENSVDLSIMQVKEYSGCRDIVSLLDNQEDQIDLQQIVMEEPLNAGQLEVDKQQQSQEVSVSLNSSFDKNMVPEIPKLNDNIKDTNYSLKANGLEIEHEMQLQGGLELEKSALTNGRGSCPVPMIEDGDIEEGEVSGDFSLDDKSIDLFYEDAVAGEKNKDEVLISEGVVDKQDSHNNEKSDAKEKHSGIGCFVASMVGSGGKVEVNEGDIDKMISESDMVVHGTSIEAKKAHGDDSVLKIGRHNKEGGGARESFDTPAVCPKSLVYYGDILEENSSTRRIILEENSTKNNALLYTEQQNANDQKKKIRGPRSTGSKERKKEKKRKKRAEKNRQLGVKRLKLQPFLKPKAVSYCRHYLKGRCQEGEKCKFSHDTIPLTKSKPCCHFARHSCMKGDDCPFDHQLSKYPCNNYTSNGTCGRGDGCMFSHQVPLKEGSPTELNASKPVLKPPSLVGDSSSKKQQSLIGSAYKNVNDTSYSVGINSHTKKEKIIAEILKPPELAPKGISYISLGKPSLVESSKIKQSSSSPKMDNGAKVGQQLEHRAPSSVQISNETPKRTSPLLAPKGINFLSFGKPLRDLSGNKSATMASDRECVIKPSLLDNHILPKQASSLPSQNNCVSVGKQEARSAIGSVQNEILKTIQPAEAALGTHTHSAEKSSLQHNNQGSLPSSGNDGTDKSSQENQTSSSKPESPRSTQWKIPVPFTSGESSKQSASGAYKNTTNSAQKALWSTFAFAAKYDSGMKMNRAVGTLAANTEANKETSIIGTGETKASKFLEFLSNIGNKTKQ